MYKEQEDGVRVAAAGDVESVDPIIAGCHMLQVYEM